MARAAKTGRQLIACLREGARRFGWHDRDPAPAIRRQDGWLVGTGVAAATYPRYAMPGQLTVPSARTGDSGTITIVATTETRITTSGIQKSQW